MSPARRVALALDALRHGWPIQIDGAFALLAAETGFGEGVTADRMLISAARAATLKLANQREAAEPDAPVLIRGAEPFDLDHARALADPALDLVYPMKGPFAAEHLGHREAARGGDGTGAAGGRAAGLPGRSRSRPARRRPSRRAISLPGRIRPRSPSPPARVCRFRRARRRKSSPSVRRTTCASIWR